MRVFYGPALRFASINAFDYIKWIEFSGSTQKMSIFNKSVANVYLFSLVQFHRGIECIYASCLIDTHTQCHIIGANTKNSRVLLPFITEFSAGKEQR